ncbi:glycosyltransferase [Amycolatopsis sp. NPDC059027]|uniref:glycosyltransferase n=1 Tax=Amycolatopsis sp. NPDC059027 TaxID=3346709 RepID=UPI00366DA722
MPDRPYRSAACTVLTRSRLAAGRVLAESYLEHHPGHEFVVLVVDGPSDGTSGPAGLRVVGHEWLDLDSDEYLRLATSHAADGLLDVVKPLALRKLLEDFDVAVLLAPEIDVHASFADITALAVEHGLVVTPSVLTPFPQDERKPGDVPGIFDGFLAAGRDARGFLDLWAERARCRKPRARVRHWFDLVAGLFPHTIVRDPGLALGYWNLHERALDDAPPKFVAFRGYDPETPWLLSADTPERPRVTLSANPSLRHLCDAYREKLLAAGHGEEVPYGFAELPDGTPITPQMRQLFHAAWVKTDEDPFGQSAEEAPPHPFGDDGGKAFQDWLSAPATPLEKTAGFSRLTMRVWATRVDLQAVFAHPTGRDAPGFRQWCSTHGVDEGLVPSWAVPTEPAAPTAPVDEFGVNVAGYLTAELGLGEMGRIVHRVVRDSGIPMVSVVEKRSLARSVRTTALADPDTVGDPKFPLSLLAVNSDFAELLLNSHPDIGHERYRIGLWAWELEDFPESMRDGFAFVDEVWTPSEFATKAIAEHAPVPVKTIPLPVPDPGPVSRAAREPGAPVRFLFAFDFNSTGGRKNPWGVVTAFQRAFPGRDDVQLVIKATNGHLHAATVERLRYAIGDDTRIELWERYLSVEELNALYAESDAYVSLHRSEGFGLTVAEAMIRGLPVIATDYSSTTEFFGADVGWPIPYELVEVGPGWVPYQEDGHWADPDLDAAAAAMCEVADNPAEARRRGAAARDHLLRTRSMDIATTWVRGQLEEAYRTWRARREPAPAPPPPPPSPLRRALRPVARIVRRAGVFANRRHDTGATA